MFRTTLTAACLAALLPFAAYADDPEVPGPPAQAQGFGGILGDPFNPLPWHEPISRTRIEVYLTGAMTECPRIWSAIPCPVVVMRDGTEQGMAIRNLTHSGAGTVTVERIEYASSVMATDAWPLHFVAVPDAEVLPPLPEPVVPSVLLPAPGGALLPPGHVPSDPYPGVEPAEIVVFPVHIREELGECGTAWGVIPCPILVMPDGTERPVNLWNYTHIGARDLLVERITYDPRTFPVADASSIVHVAIGGE